MKNIILFSFLLLVLISCKQQEEVPETKIQTPEISSVQESNDQQEANNQQEFVEGYDSSSVFHVASIPRFLVDSIKNDH